MFYRAGLVVFIVFCIIGCFFLIRFAIGPTPHELAIERFESLRKTGFKASDPEVFKAIGDCFPKGMEASRVQKLLDTATKYDPGNGQLFFSWEINTGHPKLVSVVVDGHPQTIVRIDWMYLP